MNDLTPCLICKLSLLNYHCEKSWKILKASCSENLKFSVLIRCWLKRINAAFRSSSTSRFFLWQLPKCNMTWLRWPNHRLSKGWNGLIDSKIKKHYQILWLLYGCFCLSQFLLLLQRYVSENWSSLKATWDWVYHKIAYPIRPLFQLNMKLRRR